MNLYLWGAILLAGLFVLLWLGEYATRVLETERLLFVLAAWTDPVRLLAWRVGFAVRDFLMRVCRRFFDLIDWAWNRLYDLLEWIWNHLRDLVEWAWNRLCDLVEWAWKTLRRVIDLAEKILRNMKLIELFNSFVDTLVFVGSILVLPFQAMRGFFNLPFRDFPTILLSIVEKNGRAIVFSWVAAMGVFLALGVGLWISAPGGAAGSYGAPVVLVSSDGSSFPDAHHLK